MSSRNRGQRAVGPKMRPGEGTIIQLSPNTANAGPPGSFQVDVASAPVPERRFAADVYGVVRNRSVIKLYFGQCPIPGAELEALLVINMNCFAVANSITAVDAMKAPNLKEIAELEKLLAAPPISVKTVPKQTATMTATITLAAIAGQDASVDFFKSSPFAMASAKDSGMLAVEPVVRVDMPSELFIGLIEQMRILSAPTK